MKKCKILLVIYGHTDWIVVRNADMDKLLKKSPQLLDIKIATKEACLTGEIECVDDIIIGLLGKKDVLY